MNWSLWNRGRLMEGEGGEGGEGGGGAAVVAPAAPAAGSSLLGGGVVTPAAGVAPHWKESLPESWNGVASLAPFTSFDGEMVSVPKEMLAKLGDSYSSTKKLVGAKMERPGTDASAEQQAYWRKVNGAPDAPEGYLNEGKSFRPESIPVEAWQGGMETEFMSIAHKHALPPEAVKDVMALYAKTIEGEIGKVTTTSQQTFAESEQRLKTEWGESYASNLAKVVSLAKFAGLSPEDPRFGDADLVLAFAKIANLNTETPFRDGGTGSANSSFEDRIKEIQDPNGTSMLSREYHGKFGSERQNAAQAHLHQLRKAITK
jgi:hypothetical protein